MSECTIHCLCSDRQRRETVRAVIKRKGECMHTWVLRMACVCMCSFIYLTVFSRWWPFGLVFGRSQWLETNDCNRVHCKASMNGEGCKGKEKGERGKGWEKYNEGRQEEEERETEGDRQRKSLRHGWMQLVQMAAWAEKPWNLKQQLQSFSSWEVEARCLWIAHSLYCGISSRKHMLSTSFCWFMGFLSPFSEGWPVVVIFNGTYTPFGLLYSNI